MPTVHPTAQVSPDARLADSVTVGPFAIIDGPAVVGPGSSIAAHAWLAGKVTIGADNSIGYGAVIGSEPQDIGFDPSTDTGVMIGEGNTIREYATIHRAAQEGACTTIGHRNFIMVGAHFGHDASVGDDNIIANNALIGGHVTVGNGAFLGGGTAFHQFLQVGDLAIVQGNAGMGKDVPPFCVAHGVNRLSGLNVIGLRRAGIGPADRKEIKSAYTLLFRSGLSPSAAIEQAGTRSWGPHARKLIEAVQSPTRRGVITRQD